MHVEQWVIGVLDRCRFHGGKLELPEQLPRDQYVAVDKILKLAGGKWDKKQRAHLFAVDAQDAIEPIIQTGQVTNKRQEFGQFFTPPDVVQLVMMAALIKPGMDVLEPSAGRGAIAFAATSAGGIVDCFELQDNHCEFLASQRPRVNMVTCGDFLSQHPARIYQRAVMNPPFAKQSDIHHVMHAIKFVETGGRVVAIMSAATEFRTTSLAIALREYVLGDCKGTITRLPEGSFRQSGTMVNACLVAFDVR